MEDIVAGRPNCERQLFARQKEDAYVKRASDTGVATLRAPAATQSKQRRFARPGQREEYAMRARRT